MMMMITTTIVLLIMMMLLIMLQMWGKNFEAALQVRSQLTTMEAQVVRLLLPIENEALTYKGRREHSLMRRSRRR